MLQQNRIDEIEQQLREAQLNADEEKLRSSQQEIFLNQDNKSMIAEQLDLGDDLERIDYLLRGYVIEVDKNGDQKWCPPKNSDMIILSDYGIHLIRNTIAWYINKNTLLSNYDNDTINQKMEDFAETLNDTVFMEYEKIFQYPSDSDCQKILNERIERKKNLKKYVYETLGIKINIEKEDEIRKEVVEQMTPIIYKELIKIREQVMKNKLKRFMILIREVQDAVHSTYLRAWKGQERTTLRQHIHISENKGTGGMVVPAPSYNPFNIFKRR